jgi:hypothetical protein
MKTLWGPVGAYRSDMVQVARRLTPPVGSFPAWPLFLRAGKRRRRSGIRTFRRVISGPRA